MNEAVEGTWNMVPVGMADEMATEAFENGDGTKAFEIAQMVLASEDFAGSETVYHNLGVTYAQEESFQTATDIVCKGIRQYPYAIDLLADSVYYGAKCGRYPMCKENTQILESRPYGLWTWRAFTLMIDYQKECSSWIADMDEVSEHLHKGLEYARQFQRVHPHAEEGYLAEYQVREALARLRVAQEDGEDSAREQRERAEEALKKAVWSDSLAAVKCALVYVDRLFERQDFDATIELCEKALGYGETQPSGREDYFIYLGALAREMRLRKDNALDDMSAVADVIQRYQLALELLTNSAYRDNVRTRMRILNSLLDASIPF